MSTPLANTKIKQMTIHQKQRVKKRAPQKKGLLVTLCICFLMSGCSGYFVGSPNAPEIRTVSIPTFTSNSFRRDVHLQLTEAVQKEILTRTHFRLAKDYEADTRLKGRIIDIRKRVLGETRFDDVRQLEYSIAVEVVWEDTRTGRILAQQQFPLSAQAVQLIAAAELAPEIGQSRATAEHATARRLAQKIVDLMESPW